MRFLGFVFISLLAGVALVALDFHLPGTYLDNFLNNHFIETFAALIGFNIAAVVFLVGQLMVIEQKFDGTLAHTRAEIKQNAYFLLATFLFSIVLLVIRPDLNVQMPGFKTNLFYYIDNSLVLTVFTLAIFSIWEILHAVFLISNKKL